ncbi:hypothetical protein BDV33DRAFT_95923 [Aspergillus novoparasiticus]|uniref:Secreted protein n=1 Tax=Aspergillus novoparasiticus TaxID=986946 RepID=A0A5N6E6K0_9EURO|nr:hypothetical protein BDV33DRAFT_95923 [Aspergillus novoparasiticus]
MVMTQVLSLMISISCPISVICPSISFLCSFFVPLESFDEKYYNHGRYYPASHRGLHPFPVDEREKDRQWETLSSFHYKTADCT